MPCRAPGVRLVGAESDSGFRESQWLVERDGHYVQLSELLYRILERVDGRSELDSIAAGVSRSTNWTATAEHIRELLATKLIPAGLVAPTSGASVNAHAGSRPRSPLRVKMRRVLLGPRVVDRFSRYLQVLYAPPLLACLVSLIAVAHGWLYLEHGLGGAVIDVLLQPGLILAAGALFVVTTIFHEFGHAAALRYGGGRVRGIGAGVYLIYPVFFSDTTDAYRLGRWARVRIDIGGFYFQSIAAVALIGLAALSGSEWLLIPVLMINLETVRQLLFPFVRLDGYWLFADLTGIPDLFSQLKPFLRSLFPRRSTSGPRLPALKPLPRIVFFSWMIVSVPVLAVLLVQFAMHSPQWIATAWSSIAALEDGLLDAVAAGDVAGASASLAQLLILTMPALASIVLSLVLSTWLASVIWRRRRAATVTRLAPASR